MELCLNLVTMYHQSSGFRWNCYTLKCVLPCTPHENTRVAVQTLTPVVGFRVVNIDALSSVETVFTA